MICFRNKNRKIFIVHHYLHNILQIDDMSKIKWESYFSFYVVDEILTKSNIVILSVNKEIYNGDVHVVQPIII